MFVLVGMLTGLMFSLIVCEVVALRDGRSFIGGALWLTGICLAQFWLALTGITAAALRGAGLGRLVDQRKPLFLPPWTGRERESLQQDLEAAANDFIGSDMTWAEHKKRWPSLTPTGTDLEISQDHGLFPEALEAYLESRE